MKKIIAVFIIVLIISLPVAANALTDKEKQEIEEIKKKSAEAQKQLEETLKQVEKAKLETRKQLEELKKKSENKAATANKSASIPEKLKSSDYSKYISNKDNAKISKIPKKIMDDNELKKYLKELHSKVEHTISKQAKNDAEKIIKEIKKKYNNNNLALANAANACWILKHQEEAVYIMGVACNNDPTDTNNINNYAAFLTMSGAPEKAIPILNNLNNKYPNNSTILNNLGQAWFTLGDTNEAEKYLNSAIRVFAYHSQANYTKSIIEAARGNQTQAIAAMKKSIERSYSHDKENKLKKMGGSLDTNPDWGFHMPQDALGLEHFVIPPYPKNFEEIDGANQQWKDFRTQCQKSSDALYAKNKILEQEWQNKSMAKHKLFTELVKTKNNKGLAKYAMEERQNYPPYAEKAMAKLMMMNKEEGGELAYYIKEDIKMREKLNEVEAQIRKLREEWLKEENKATDNIPEDTGCADYNICLAKTKEVTNKYLPQINDLWNEYNTEYVRYLKRKTNTMAYYNQYTLQGDLVQIMENKLKIDYLYGISTLNVELPRTQGLCLDFSGGEGSELCEPENKAKPIYRADKLQDFYDLHCDNKISMDIKIIRWEFACNKATANIDAEIFSAEWKENLDTGAFKGTAEIGVSIGKTLGSRDYGPLTAELGAEMRTAGFLEFDNSGVTDFGAKIGAGATAGVNGADGTLIGAEARFGWNSGITTSGEGVLAGRI